ncbi:class I histocompatibility antigen, F10 alpha chain-like isoform 1-T1 [Clarias gariepinus]
MELSSVLIKVLFFLMSSFLQTSAVTHSLQYIYTAVTPGINFPEFTIVGQVDGQQFNFYHSKIRRMIPKTEWILKNDAKDPEYWNRNTQIAQDSQEIFKVNVGTAMQRFNQTKGVHTVQLMYGCELDDDGTTRGYTQYGYDGEDFISFDLKTLTWIAPTPQALITKNKWDPDTEYNKGRKNYLKNTCIKWLKKYVSYGRETLERKVCPKVSVFQKHSPSSEVVCHTTGFFPKAVMITWQKDGEDVYENVKISETLPNQDGSFQRRSILKVPAEELQKHIYTCVVQHSSLWEELVREVPKDSSAVLLNLITVVGAMGGIIFCVLIFRHQKIHRGVEAEDNEFSEKKMLKRMYDQQDYSYVVYSPVSQ